MAPRAVFLGRVFANTLFAIVLIGASLALGMAGYRFTEHMSWLDAYLNAAMLLGGMGPVTPVESEAGKFFAGSYALYCGLVVVITAGVILAPILHRVLHALHVEAE
ncbi:MAG: hypothetical protein JNN10_05340 [Sphingopyxis sp.]|uniref:hypothetical protein n=1 Tax=Sphingopyxis sp. TaxID=1908224 RepID=UPI001A5952C8|nr:hypothetical protein [Sphingopyxis sp.]MBL9065697.1 hypothetical protein [Sphingopyxis sp.]